MGTVPPLLVPPAQQPDPQALGEPILERRGVYRGTDSSMVFRATRIMWPAKGEMSFQ